MSTPWPVAPLVAVTPAMSQRLLPRMSVGRIPLPQPPASIAGARIPPDYGKAIKGLINRFHGQLQDWVCMEAYQALASGCGLQVPSSKKQSGTRLPTPDFMP